jgi:hypothetical protein
VERCIPNANEEPRGTIATKHPLRILLCLISLNPENHSPFPPALICHCPSHWTIDNIFGGRRGKSERNMSSALHELKARNCFARVRRRWQVSCASALTGNKKLCATQRIKKVQRVLVGCWGRFHTAPRRAAQRRCKWGNGLLCC